jgi:hypothetical protein
MYVVVAIHDLWLFFLFSLYTTRASPVGIPRDNYSNFFLLCDVVFSSVVGSSYWVWSVTVTSMFVTVDQSSVKLFVNATCRTTGLLLQGCHFKIRGTSRQQCSATATQAISNELDGLCNVYFQYVLRCGFMRISWILTHWSPNYFWCMFVLFLANIRKKSYEYWNLRALHLCDTLFPRYRPPSK